MLALPSWGMNMRIVLAALVVAFAAAAPAQAPAGDAVRARGMVAAFEQWARAQHISQGAIAVMHDGRLIDSNGYGGRRADDVALVGSVSKSITALCISRYVDAGKLRYDETVGEALAPFLARVGPPADPRLLGVTLTQLLTHRSGMVRAIPAPRTRADLAPGMRSPLEEQARRALRAPLETPPGTTYSYSNQGYVLLSLIAGIAGGSDFEAACRKALLDPAGMSDVRLEPTVTGRARAGAGAWMISADEDARLAQLLDPASPQMGPATRAWIAARAGDTPIYALGYEASPRPGGRWLIHHNGLLNDYDASASAAFAKWPNGWTVAINVAPARPKQLQALMEHFVRTMTPNGPPLAPARGAR